MLLKITGPSPVFEVGVPDIVIVRPRPPPLLIVAFDVDPLTTRPRAFEIQGYEPSCIVVSNTNVSLI